jgi:hypothetical protein
MQTIPGAPALSGHRPTPTTALRRGSAWRPATDPWVGHASGAYMPAVYESCRYTDAAQRACHTSPLRRVMSVRTDPT